MKPPVNPSPYPVQLYDTVADIGEKNNLAAANADVVKRLQAAYAAHIAEIKKNRRPTASMPREKGSSSAERPNPRKKNPKKISEKMHLLGTPKVWALIPPIIGEALRYSLMY